MNTYIAFLRGIYVVNYLSRLKVNTKTRLTKIIFVSDTGRKVDLHWYIRTGCLCQHKGNTRVPVQNAVFIFYSSHLQLSLIVIRICSICFFPVKSSLRYLFFILEILARNPKSPSIVEEERQK